MLELCSCLDGDWAMTEGAEMVTITIGDELVLDDLLSLHQELDIGGLGSCVSLRRQPLKPGALGAITDAVIAVVTSSAVASALASVLITWIRHRAGDREFTATREDGSTFSVKATNVHQRDAADLRALAQELAAFLEADLQPGADGSALARAEPAPPAAGDAEL
jgi:membrane-associated two-gene conflict system component 1 (EACC1)